MKDFNRLTLKQLQEQPEKIFHELRWKNGVYCPKCGSVTIHTRDDQHRCCDCDNRFSDRSGTIFHSCKLSTYQILTAIYFFISNTRGISSYQLARHIGVTQFTAWRLLTKLRSAIHTDLQLSGNIIIDELYLGGQAKFKPLHKKLPEHIIPIYKSLSPKQLKTTILEYASHQKMPTIGIIGDEHSVFGRKSVVLRYMEDAVSKVNIQKLIIPLLTRPTRLITDHSMLYPALAKSLDVPHSVCDHGEYTYASPDGFSSSQVEGLFSQVRRMFSGTYTICSRKHLQKYLDECALRYNMRGYTNLQRFRLFSDLVFP